MDIANKVDEWHTCMKMPIEEFDLTVLRSELFVTAEYWAGNSCIAHGPIVEDVQSTAVCEAHKPPREGQDQSPGCEFGAVLFNTYQTHSRPPCLFWC